MDVVIAVDNSEARIAAYSGAGLLYLALSITSSLTVVKTAQECIKAVDFALKHFQKGMAFIACIANAESHRLSMTPFEL